MFILLNDCSLCFCDNYFDYFPIFKPICWCIIERRSVLEFSP